MSDTSDVSRPPPRAPSNPTTGVVALVMGILGLTALPLVGSILALVFASQSRQEVERAPQLYTDEMGRIGRILGWVGIGLALLGLLLSGVVLAIFLSL